MPSAHCNSGTQGKSGENSAFAQILQFAPGLPRNSGIPLVPCNSGNRFAIRAMPGMPRNSGNAQNELQFGHCLKCSADRALPDLHCTRGDAQIASRPDPTRPDPTSRDLEKPRETSTGLDLEVYRPTSRSLDLEKSREVSTDLEKPRPRIFGNSLLTPRAWTLYLGHEELHR